jgi:hypothetical protein
MRGAHRFGLGFIPDDETSVAGAASLTAADMRGSMIWLLPKERRVAPKPFR